jgi:thymidylate synthase (FAD)
MIKVVNPSVEVWKQDDYTLDAIFKHIARCTRVAYQSIPKNENEDAYNFLLRTIFKGYDFFGYNKVDPKNPHKRILSPNAYGDVDLTSLHLSCCEHATVHLKFPTFMPRAAAMWEGVYEHNKYSRTNNHDGYLYVTTNLRVIIENYAIDTLEFIDTTPNCPYYMPRTTVCFITDIGASRELNRHRVNSIVEESTRYCAYDKGKFGNGITVAKLPWVPDVDPTDEGHDYNEGFFNDNEVFDNNVIEEQYTDNWTAVDWFFYGLQICDLVYRKTRELGWTAQQAREILPLNTKTQVVHTAFVDDWEHWIKLRANQVSGKVHPSLLKLSLKLKDLLYGDNCKF